MSPIINRWPTTGAQELYSILYAGTTGHPFRLLLLQTLS